MNGETTMLSRKTRQQAIELMQAVNAGVVRLFSPGGAAMLEEGIAALSAIRDICWQELPAERFGFYRDATDTLHTALKQLQSDGKSDIVELCHQLLEGLIRELRAEPVKKEIVFLPYKASMWDSLESIWQAAVADKEHCNAYVVAIPYADLTPEHTAKEWHCEKELFPKYVPVLDFRTVNLEKMHPDVIFIHNPYDGANRVTSVDSHYYSSELKKYTETLVYVPYFVSGPGITPALCQAPGIVNADYVMLETKAIKEQYERNYPGGEPPKGKFLALGSPKYDKILAGKKKNYPLSKEWQRLVEGKKIVLYNTSLSAALQYSDEVVGKLRQVLDFFHQREDVILWWRPHPLMKATFASMRPQYASEYCQIEEQYIEEGWGIYDDSPDASRAIVWADAYYGDDSSVIHLYRKTGKPMLIEYMPTMADERYHRWFPMVAYDGEMAWFITSANLFSGLYQLDMKIDEVTFLAELPGSYAQMIEYGAIGKIGTKIVILPFYCQEGALEYDLVRGDFQTIPLPPDAWLGGSQAEAFGNTFQYRDSLYFIGNANGLIVEYNETKRCQFHTAWADGLAIPVEKICFSGNAGVQIAGHVYLPVMGMNHILELELETMRATLHTLPEDIASLTLSYDGEDFWVTPYQGNRTICWNLTSGKTKTYLLPVPAETVFGFARSITMQGRQVFFPFLRSEILSVDKKTGEVRREYEWEKQYGTVLYQDNCFSVQQADDAGKIFLAYLYYHRSLLEIDTSRSIMREHKVRFSWLQDISRWETSKARIANAIHYERYGMGIRDFLQLRPAVEQTIENGGTEAGQRIYDWLKNEHICGMHNGD